MTTNCENTIAEIVVGSKAEFTVDLVTEDNKPFNLSNFVSGNAVFCNLAGSRFEIALTLPGANPELGSLTVSIPAATTAQFDKKSTSFDIELVDGLAETTVIPINDMIELIERNCPPIV